MPYENAEKQLVDLKAKLDAASSNEFMALTANLRKQDFTLIGRFIQTYCFADINARRIIDSVRGAAGEKQIGSTLNDTDTLKHLKLVAEMLPIRNAQIGLVAAAETIEMHRNLRHHFAHWATRRVKRRDMFIIFSKNALEAKRRDGQDLTPNHLKFGLVPIRPLRQELDKLTGHAKYMAVAAAHIDSRFDELVEHFKSPPI